MKRVFQLVTVLAAAALLNGCTKCSQDQQPAEPPPVVEPQGESMPGDTMPEEGAPADETAPTDEGMPEGEGH